MLAVDKNLRRISERCSRFQHNHHIFTTVFMDLGTCRLAYKVMSLATSDGNVLVTFQLYMLHLGIQGAFVHQSILETVQEWLTKKIL